MRERKRQALEADATKCVKINELFAGRPAKDFSEDVSRATGAGKGPFTSKCNLMHTEHNLEIYFRI